SWHGQHGARPCRPLAKLSGAAIVRLPARHPAWRDGGTDAAGCGQAQRPRYLQPDSLSGVAAGEMMNKPVVAVTFGDASGIGPELVAKLLVRPEALAAPPIVFVGD